MKCENRKAGSKAFEVVSLIKVWSFARYKNPNLDTSNFLSELSFYFLKENASTVRAQDSVDLFVFRRGGKTSLNLLQMKMCSGQIKFSALHMELISSQCFTSLLIVLSPKMPGLTQLPFIKQHN